MNKLSSSGQIFMRFVLANIYHLHLSWWYIYLTFILKSKPGLSNK